MTTITIESKLRELTNCFKSDYMELTRVWAMQEVDKSKEVLSRSIEDWCKYFGLNTRMVGNKIEFPFNFYNTANASKMNRLCNAARSTVQNPDKYVAFCLNKAEVHFESCLLKVVNKLQQKGVTADCEVSAVSSDISMDFQFLIEYVKGGTRYQLRCYTIVASGEVQRPHFRFLIK